MHRMEGSSIYSSTQPFLLPNVEFLYPEFSNHFFLPWIEQNFHPFAYCLLYVLLTPYPWYILPFYLITLITITPCKWSDPQTSSSSSLPLFKGITMGTFFFNIVRQISYSLSPLVSFEWDLIGCGFVPFSLSPLEIYPRRSNLFWCICYALSEIWSDL